jgi:nicotinamidase-related amidase
MWRRAARDGSPIDNAGALFGGRRQVAASRIGAPMAFRNEDLHGNAPDKCAIALLLIDVINDLEFPAGDQLLRHALPMAKKLRDLKRRAKKARIPVIYVNNNFGRWQSNFRTQVEHCLNDGVRGRPVVELLIPEDDDYFVLKPKHSGFFSTTLDILLQYLGCTSVILTGVAGNNCVLFTANDAYMRDLSLNVPRDCVASNSEEENCIALDQMSKVLKADIQRSSDLDLTQLLCRFSRSTSDSVSTAPASLVSPLRDEAQRQ